MKSRIVPLFVPFVVLLITLSSCSHKDSVRLVLDPSEIPAALAHADALLKANKLDSARAWYASVREKDKLNRSATIGLAKVALEEHSWDEASEYAARALKSDTGNVSLHYILAVADREAGTRFQWTNPRWSASRDAFDWLLARDSMYEDVLYQYGVLEQYRNEEDHALGLMREQLARKPDLVDARLGLYKLYRHFMSLRDSSTFLEWLRPQIGTLPRFFEGETFRRAGNFGQADSVFTLLVDAPGEVCMQAVRIARARLLMAQGKRQQAEDEYWLGVRELTTDIGAALLFEDIKHIVSDGELNYYNSLLTVEARQDFFRSFWNSRNTTYALKTNTRMQEHFARYAFAEQHYEYPGFKTWFNNPDNELSFPKAFSLNEEFNDMGMIYLRQGPPDDVVRHNYSPFDEDDAADRLEGVASSDTSAVKDVNYLDKQALRDQLRDEYRRAARDDFESWLYRASTESPKMIFHFQKHQTAKNNWRLVSFPAFAPMLDQLASWDPKFQRMYESRYISDRAILETEMKSESKTVVNYALSTDRETHEKKVTTFRFPVSVDMFRAPDSRTMLDISYAFPIATFVQNLPDSVETVPTEIGFSLVDSHSHKAASELDTVNVELGPNREGAVVNLIRYTVPADSYAVAVQMRPLVGNMLGTWRQGVRVPDFTRNGFMVSSVQYLRPSPLQGSIEIEGVRVIQSPFSTHVRTEPLYLYFQIYNLIPDGDGNTAYTTECILLPAGKTDPDEGEVIYKKHHEGSDKNLQEFYMINVKSVDPGRYRLIVKVTDKKRVETLLTSRWIEILKP
jgi:hypothetical protein